MSWVTLLQPDIVLADSVVGITPELLEEHGLKGLVLDVDETIVPVGRQQLEADVQTWIEAIQRIVPISLVSNNVGRERIRLIGEGLGVPYVASAGKPSRKKLRKAAEAMDLPLSQIAMVGDRLFTDVLAGNRLGLFTILVQPMLTPNSRDPKNLLRNAEFWISQQLGVTLKSVQ